MRPVERGPHPTDEQGMVVAFREYADARPHLEARLGNFCSYCGMRLDASLAVEHVKPKSLHPELKVSWDNFLLACTNCNSTKLDEPIQLDDYVWPDVDNPLLLIEYAPQPRVRAGLDPDVHDKAKRTLELTGLDHQPTAQQSRRSTDKRWSQRQQAWDKATRALRRIQNHDVVALREQAIETATSDGYWSVWYTVLSRDPDLRRRMVECLPGTSRACFDAEHRPIARARP